MHQPRTVGFTGWTTPPSPIGADPGRGRRARRDHWLGTVVRLLESMKGYTFGYRVDRYEQSLQSATRAHREGARVDLVVAALLHDIGDDLCPDNHSEVAAAILRPVLDDEAVWVVRHHGCSRLSLRREAGRTPRQPRPVQGFAYFDTCAHFCAAWDQESFDPEYDSEPLEFFMPMLEEVFSRPPKVWGDQDLPGRRDERPRATPSRRPEIVVCCPNVLVARCRRDHGARHRDRGGAALGQSSTTTSGPRTSGSRRS